MADRIRFHLNEHVDPAIASALRRAGIDVTTTIQAGLRTQDDEAHLRFARDENRVIVTRDQDFLRLASGALDHSGIVFYTANQSISPLMQVQYSPKRPMVPQFEELPENLHETVFLTKSEQWSYEEELRMFAQPKAANLVEKDSRGFELYLFDLPPDVFAEIILGHWMAQDKKGEIATLAQEKYPQVELYGAKLNETSFDLDIVRYT